VLFKDLPLLTGSKERKKKMLKMGGARSQMWMLLACVSILLVLEIPITKGELPRFGHIFVIVMENREFGSVIGNDNAPYFNRLVTDEFCYE